MATRKIIQIDEEKCDGCGLCIPNCHEGALQVIDGKARLISDLMCDGLGACLGHCPQDAITVEEREAQPYNETLVMENMVGQGENVVRAHFKHLKEHREFAYLSDGVDYLKTNQSHLPFDAGRLTDAFEVKKETDSTPHTHQGSSLFSMATAPQGSSCPGSASRSFGASTAVTTEVEETPSALSHWPVQMHLVNPAAPHYRGSDVLLAADCVAYAAASFHQQYLKGKTLAIACPKLDSNKEVYLQKLIRMIDEAGINTLTVMIMTVPCCGGLLQIAKMAVGEASVKIPLKAIVIDVQGNKVSEEWV